MSVEFVKMISQLHNERYLVQVNNVISNKISCGLFFGFELPKIEEIAQTVNQLKNFGFNLQCIYLLNDAQKDFLKQNLTPPPVI